MGKNIKKTGGIYRVSFLSVIFLFLFYFSSNAATCTAALSVELCVAIDDIAVVWLNGTNVGTFTYVNWDQNGVYPTCITLTDPTIIQETGNVVAIDVVNTQCCEIWGSWSIETMCSDGTSHSCLTSDDVGMRLYNQPTPPVTPPPNDGSARPWYAKDYTETGTWQAATMDTGTIYGKLIYNPCTGQRLQPLSYDAEGAATIPGGHIYMRQPFAMNPVTPLPTPYFSISKAVYTPTPGGTWNSTLGYRTNERVTYGLLVCNHGEAIVDASSLLNDDFDNGFSFDGPYGGDCDGYGDGSPCSQGNSGYFTTKWMRGFPGMTCVTLTARVVDYWLDGGAGEYCQIRSNWAGIHWSGDVVDKVSNTVTVQMYCPGTPSFTRTFTPTRTITDTITVTPTRTETSTRTSIPTLTRTLSHTITPTITMTWTISNTWTPHTGSETFTPTVTRTWSRTSTRTWTLTPTPTYTPSITITATATITQTWETAITIQKSEDKDRVAMGDTVQYCITFTNVGANYATFHIWDTIPDVTNFLWCTSGCTTSGAQGNNFVVDWFISNVPPGESGSVCVWVELARFPYFKPLKAREYFARLNEGFLELLRGQEYIRLEERSRGTP